MTRIIIYMTRVNAHVLKDLYDTTVDRDRDIQEQLLIMTTSTSCDIH